MRLWRRGAEQLAVGAVSPLMWLACPWLLIFSMAPFHTPERLLGQVARKVEKVPSALRERVQRYGAVDRC